jgi:hypothetical protein
MSTCSKMMKRFFALILLAITAAGGVAAQSLTPQIGGGIGITFDGGISGAGGSSNVDPLERKVVWSRGQQNTDLTTDAPAGQRATLVSSRGILPYSSIAPDPTGGIYFVFWAGWIDVANGEKSLANDSTWRVGFEANSQTKQLTFSGATSKTVLANSFGTAAVFISDPVYPADVGLVTWPTASNAFWRIDVSVASGGSTPGWSANGGTGEGVRYSADIGVYQSGNTGALATPSGAQTFGFAPGPLAIVGKWGAVGLPSFGGLGDSIAAGQGDATDTGTGTTSGGFMPRAFRGAGVPYIRMSRGADDYSSSIKTSNWAVRKYVARFLTDIVDEFGINGALPAATQFSLAQAYYQVAYSSGVQRIGKTAVTPSGSSSNSFIDKAGQTPFQTPGGIQDTLNALNVAATGSPGGPNLYSDLRSVVGDPSDLHYWLTNGTVNYPTTDGTHPTSTFHGFMAAKLTETYAKIFPVVYASAPAYQTLNFSGYNVERSTLNLAAAQSPNYQLTASSVVEDTTLANGHDIIKNATFTTTAKTYLATVYVKRGVGTRNFGLSFFDASFGSAVFVRVDPSNFSIVTAASVTGTSFSAPSATVAEGPLGYAKVTLTFTSVSGQSLWASLALVNGTNPVYDGDGASNMLMWGLDVR